MFHNIVTTAFLLYFTFLLADTQRVVYQRYPTTYSSIYGTRRYGTYAYPYSNRYLYFGRPGIIGAYGGRQFYGGTNPIANGQYGIQNGNYGNYGSYGNNGNYGSYGNYGLGNLYGTTGQFGTNRQFGTGNQNGNYGTGSPYGSNYNTGNGQYSSNSQGYSNRGNDYDDSY